MNPNKSFKIKGGHGDGMKVGPEKNEAKSKTMKHYHKAQMKKMIGYIDKGEKI